MPRKPITPELVSDIVANPTKYGFEWTRDEVHKGEMSMGLIPLVKHLDTALLAETFGDELILASMDGTSRHVTNQRIGRDARWDNRKVTEDEIKVAIVENMLGKKATRKTVVVEKIVEKRIFVAYDDTEFETKEERDEYNAVLKAEGKLQ